ncbi:hypothetical protein NCAS_0H01520 [Naumovozyma castellii]|uniref:Uncharacterized protein n=1 Tax=Naumovozyma castellii TaxID=27288 RepID=G0VIY5_NAUCA|nr:hypothetical protein NCAS_0H01520 [Naumovozyma castellii CBS 4309]CCC71462.1 hypothetical protein NCAS_0H01520 [Naumovozyma castellii CBS 4309]
MYTASVSSHVSSAATPSLAHNSHHVSSAPTPSSAATGHQVSSTPTQTSAAAGHHVSSSANSRDVTFAATPSSTVNNRHVSSSVAPPSVAYANHVYFKKLNRRFKRKVLQLLKDAPKYDLSEICSDYGRFAIFQNPVNFEVSFCHPHTSFESDLCDNIYTELNNVFREKITEAITVDSAFDLRTHCRYYLKYHKGIENDKKVKESKALINCTSNSLHSNFSDNSSSEDQINCTIPTFRKVTVNEIIKKYGEGGLTDKALLKSLQLRESEDLVQEQQGRNHRNHHRHQVQQQEISSNNHRHHHNRRNHANRNNREDLSRHRHEHHCDIEEGLEYTSIDSTENPDPPLTGAILEFYSRVTGCLTN